MDRAWHWLYGDRGARRLRIVGSSGLHPCGYSRGEDLHHRHGGCYSPHQQFYIRANVSEQCSMPSSLRRAAFPWSGFALRGVPAVWMDNAACSVLMMLLLLGPEVVEVGF